MIDNPKFLHLGRAKIAIFRLTGCCAYIQEDMSGYYRTAAIEKVTQIEFIFKWLNQRGISICLISDYNRIDTQHILDRLSWSPKSESSYIDAVLIRGNRSALLCLREVAQLYGFQNLRSGICLFDQLVLLEASWRLESLLTIGLTYGSTPPRILAQKPHHILLDSIVELPNFITRKLALSKPIIASSR
ncbi:MAG: hypothetical protein AAF741_14845 [Bacteroidota bacterium]